jgi:hypothetical protein
MTLARVFEVLGPEVLQLVSAPKGIDVEVADPLIHDPVHPPPIEPGDIVLAVGTNPDAVQALELVREAAEAGAAAIAFKVASSVPMPLLDTADSTGIAVLTLPLELAWGQFHAVLRTLLASRSSPSAAGAGVPVGDLFALANAIAAMVGGPVVIDDPQLRVLAYSNLDEPIDDLRRKAILLRRPSGPWPKRFEEDGIFRRLWNSHDVVRIHYPGIRNRLVVAIRAGEEILGCIWVAEGRRPFTRATEEALREAAGIASLHLIHRNITEDLQRRMRADLLWSVLEGRGGGHVASRLGIEATAYFAVVAFEIQGDDEVEIASVLQRAVDLIGLHYEVFFQRASCAGDGKTIYVLVTTSEPISTETLLSITHQAIERAECGLHVKLVAGIGSPVDRLQDVPRSRREAHQVLRLLGLGGARRVAHIDAVRAETILSELQDVLTQRPYLRSDKLTSLMEYDERHGTSYVKTLRAYLDTFGDISRAAGLIHVHPNTFRYRLARLFQLSGINLDDPSERLVTELQLRFL